MNYYDTCMFSLSDCWLYLPLHDIVIIFLFLGDNVSYTRLQLMPMFCSCYCAASLGATAYKNGIIVNFTVNTCIKLIGCFV